MSTSTHPALHPHPCTRIRIRTPADRAGLRVLALAAGLAVAAGACAAPPAAPMTDAALAETVGKRLLGDRTGACFATATIDGDHVARAYVCADGSDPERRIGARTAFEIGSVSKTMLGALLAELIREDKAALDDALADYLPEGSVVPQFGGQPIRLRHLVTHTSGLPAIPADVMHDAQNPYAALDADALLQALAKTTLTRAPGAQFEYSNFAAMLLSYAVARRSGEDFETLLRTRLFAPLGMAHAYIGDTPDGVRAAQGHLPNAQPTPAWTFGENLAGVGGVRATLDDMVRYVQGQMGTAPQPLLASLQLSQQPVDTPAGAPMAMHWMRAPLGGTTWLTHEGGTGGFSSFVAFDPKTRRGAIVLSDTALHSLGGLGGLGLHLLDLAQPLAKPRRAVAPPSELLDALVGDYDLGGVLKMTLRRRADARQGDTLEIQAEGQPAFAMGYDDAGDFFPLALDALLTPHKAADGRMGFIWAQGGGRVAATRIDPAPQAGTGAAPAPAAAPLADYAGDYPLAPGFVLNIRVENGTLVGQATGQGAIPLAPTAPDVFEFPAADIVIRFERDDGGRVQALSLLQRGRTTRAERQ